MTDTLAYQIGAVFFLAVLFMAGTMTRGLFPTRIFDNVKMTVFVVAVLLVGFVVYRGLPELSSLLDFLPSSAPQTPSNAAPAAAAIKQRAPIARLAAKLRPVPDVLDAAPVHIAAQPQAAQPPQSADAPAPAAAAIKQRAPIARPAAKLRPVPDVLDAAPVHIAAQPQAAQPPQSADAPAPTQSWQATPAQQSGNRVTRAVESVGHFLHIGHAKYQPAPVAPQPATPPDQGKSPGAP